jgi:hypothetical protein
MLGGEMEWGGVYKLIYQHGIVLLCLEGDEGGMVL